MKNNHLTICLFLATLAGCGGYVRHFGDAKVIADFRSPKGAYSFTVKNIPINHKATYVYKVTDLPEPIIPTNLSYPNYDTKITPSWKNTKIKVSLISFDGNTNIISKTIEPQLDTVELCQDMNKKNFYPTNYKLWDAYEVEKLNMKSYLIEVEIVEPSTGQLDAVELSHFFRSEKNYKALGK